ncbi:MAG: hypothetical protein AAF848_16455 [Pseudomonadota bacterium]
MFREWGFLLGELWGLLICAALIGLLAGWIFWGRRQAVVSETGKVEDLRLQLTRCQASQEDKDALVRTLRHDLEEARAAAAAIPAARLVSAPIHDPMPEPVVAADPEPVIEPEVEVEVEVEAEPEAKQSFEEAPAPYFAAAAVDVAPEPKTQVSAAAMAGDLDYDGDGIVEGTDEGRRPEGLTQARNNSADDLKRIKGIGPKLEILCNSLGFYHFDQIAAWTDAEVAWVDANLKGFKGRVTRDKWVVQAGLLADGGETVFSRKVDKGDVYEE